MNAPQYQIPSILFEKKSARLAVPHYHLLAVLLQEDTILFRFDAFRVRVKGENLGVLFEQFCARHVWSLREGRWVQFANSDGKYLISHIRFHGTEIDNLDEGPVPAEPTMDEFSETKGLAEAMLRFETAGQEMRLALPANNLLQLMSDGSGVSMLFERWKVRLSGKGISNLYEDLRYSRLSVVREGESVKDALGGTSFHVTDIKFAEVEE